MLCRLCRLFATDHGPRTTDFISYAVHLFAQSKEFTELDREFRVAGQELRPVRRSAFLDRLNVSEKDLVQALFSFALMAVGTDHRVTQYWARQEVGEVF